MNNSTYTTLASSLAVMAIFDITAALALFAYALTQNVLPSVHVIPDLPSFDFGWLLQRPRLFAGVSLGLGIAIGVGIYLGRAARRGVQGSASPRGSPCCAARAATCAGSRSGRPSTGRPGSPRRSSS